MSREPRQWAVLAALRAADEASGGEAETEVLLRVSRGVSVRRARGTPAESAAWREETVAVRALLPGGGEGLATAASWEDAEAAARTAVALAAESGDRAGAEARPALAPARGRAPALGDVAAEPQPEGELLASIAELERAALAVDERIVALDAALARSAIIDSCLASTAGTAVHQRHASAAAHAAIIARDGMSVAVRGDAWAGARLTLADAARAGARLGRAGLVHLVGSGAAPPQPPAVLLQPAALAEMTLPLLPVLLGLSSEGPRGASGLPAALSLREDSCDDAAARRLAVDGAGRPLRPLDVIRGGEWSPPGASRLPSLRAGSGDAPRPGWLRLTWSWEDGVAEDDLPAALGTGLWIETAHAIATDPASLHWRGAVSGFWVEDGRRRHAVAGVPFAASLMDLLSRARAGGREPESAHPSGSLRAAALVVDRERAEA